MAPSGTTLVAARLAAQQLTGPPARRVEEVVTRLLAVQAQDLRAARLAVRSRSVGLAAADVDAALAERSVLITWLNRGTLHLVTAADFWWLHPLTTPQLATGNARRLRQEGVSVRQADRGVELIVEAVRARPQTRAQLRERLDGAGVPTRGQALVHVLAAAALRGSVVRGPMVGGEHAYVSVRDWLGPPPPALDRDEALARLARRYLAGHGPADARDLAKWAGVPLRDARRGLAVIADELVSWGADLVCLRDPAPPDGVPGPRLLGGFDPLLHGWVSREPFVGGHQQVVTTNGLFRPTALVDGRVVGVWGLADGVLSIRLLEPVAGEARERLCDDAGEVLRFVGLPERPAVIE